ncbi:RidA family protein [Parapedobacter lycopersici]|uniref:RidA family protein n=1 Tax=Parapedobacter lycopersici TaxID=1864939 RepID=UPI00214D34D0|nr:RidA family protein [Parapedobacter lycopersici]
MKRREILKSLTVLPLVGVAAATPEKATAAPAKQAWTPKKEAIPLASYPTSSPLSTCIRSGNLLFICGIGGWYEARRKEPGDIQVQVKSALTIMKELLENAGSSMANVLKVHMTLAEPNKNIGPLNEVYGDFFPDPKPVRSYSGAGVDQMGRDGILIQIDCIAYVD